MSEFTHRLVFKPITGEFSLDRITLTGGNGASGTVASGSLTFPSGASFQIVDGIAVNNGAEIVLAAGAEIVVT